MLRRKTGKVVAVSCPYLPLNKGFRATMQAIEYVMMSFLQASYNIQGAIGIWGGCILVDKKPFLEVGQFSHQAIIEDMDLAFKLTKSGYKVEQALIPVKPMSRHFQISGEAKKSDEDLAEHNAS